jgi:Domain of unknown function (DUF4157)
MSAITARFHAKAATDPMSCVMPLHRPLLQRKCACGSTPGLTGECEACSKKKRFGLQTKLKVNEAGDIYQQEADRIADQVLATAVHPGANGAPPRIQCFASQMSGQADAALASVDQTLASPSSPLEPTLQQEMGRRFGYDFSSVRVHTDARAAESARAVNARAYTVGEHVVFDAGCYSPTTPTGQRLLAHELAHVVQQSPATLRSAPTLMRQATSETRPKPWVRQFAYDRSNFSDRFDGEVDAANHRVTLVMRLNLEDYGKPEGKDERIAKFRAKAQALLEKTWSYVYALQSVCHGAADKFEARVRVVMDASNPHHTIHVWEEISGERSSSTEWQQGDLETQERPTSVLVDPKKPPSKKNIRKATFYQVPAAHEFGHLLGLTHIVCQSNSDRCYGVTAEQKMDIMGYGSVVSERDYTPFVRIMERYGRDSLPTECNKWKLVAPG